LALGLWLTAAMVNLGKLAKKAKSIAEKQGDKIAHAVDKTTDAVDKKTKGKYSAKLEKVDEMARKLDKTPKADAADADADADAPKGDAGTGAGPTD
jgi:hypothetical protein